MIRQGAADKMFRYGFAVDNRKDRYRNFPELDKKPYKLIKYRKQEG